MGMWYLCHLDNPNVLAVGITGTERTIWAKLVVILCLDSIFILVVDIIKD